MLTCRCIPLFCLFNVILTAADPFAGNWRLNIQKSDLSGSNVKGGTTTFQPIGTGYLYNTEIVFGDSRIGRLNGPVQFDGTVNETLLDGRSVTFVSLRLDENNYQTVISDAQTGTTTNIFRYAVQGDTLTFCW